MRTILIVCWVITLILLFRHQSVLQSARSKQRQKEYDFGHEFAKRHWLRSQLKYRTRRSIAKNVCLEENSPSLEHKHLYCHWIIIIPVTNCAWSVSRPYAWECGEDSGWDTRKAVKWQWTNLSHMNITWEQNNWKSSNFCFLHRLLVVQFLWAAIKYKVQSKSLAKQS